MGSNLIPALLQAGHSVKIISRGGDFENKYIDNVQYFSGEYNDQSILERALPDTDLVIHLAYSTVPENSTLNPVSDIQTNVIPTLQFIEACSGYKVKRFYFVSSGGVVYGNRSEFPIKESDKTEPVSSYGISKLMIENQISLLKEKYGIDCCIFRVANAYGIGQTDRNNQGVVNIWMNQIQTGSTINVMGDGNVIRDYIYVDDVSAAFVKAIENNLSGIFNIGTGVGTSLNDLIITLERVLNKKAKIHHSGFRKFDVQKNVLDISLFKKMANWSPSVDLEEGIKRIYRHKIES